MEKLEKRARDELNQDLEQKRKRVDAVLQRDRERADEKLEKERLDLEEQRAKLRQEEKAARVERERLIAENAALERELNVRNGPR